MLLQCLKYASVSSPQLNFVVEWQHMNVENNAMFSIKILYEEFRSIVSSNDRNIGMKLCVNHVTK